MVRRTPTAGLILLHPGVHFKSVKGNALFANRNLCQLVSDFPVKAVAVHPQVSGGIPEAYQSRQDSLHFYLAK